MDLHVSSNHCSLKTFQFKVRKATETEENSFNKKKRRNFLKRTPRLLKYQRTLISCHQTRGPLSDPQFPPQLSYRKVVVNELKLMC